MAAPTTERGRAATRRRVLGVLTTFTALAAGAAGAAWYRAGRADVADAAIAAPDGPLDAFAGLGLIDQDGRPFRPEPLRGRLVLLNFFFLGCGTVCPATTRTLLEAVDGLPAATRADLRLVSISVDPVGDTPAALKRYAQAIGADRPDWRFVATTPAALARLSVLLDVFGPGGDPSPQGHRGDVALLDRRGHIVQRYTGATVGSTRLVRDLAALQALAAA